MTLVGGIRVNCASLFGAWRRFASKRLFGPDGDSAPKCSLSHVDIR